MGFIKDFGKLAGGVAGLVIGGPVYLAGEVVNSNFLREIGEGACKVTERTGELLGSVTEGVAETVYGTVTKDIFMQSNGFEKVVESGGSYIKGVGNGVSKMVENGLRTTEAIIDGDTDTAVKVGTEMLKTVAVGVLAVGVIDAFDGIEASFDSVDYELHLADNNDFMVESLEGTADGFYLADNNDFMVESLDGTADGLYLADNNDFMVESFDDTNDGLGIAVNNIYDGMVDGLNGLDGMVDGLFDTINGFFMADNVDFIENPNEHYVTPFERHLSDGRTIWVDGDGDTTVATYGGWLQSNPDYKA